MFFQFIVISIAIGAAVGNLSECRTRLANDCLNKELPRELPSTPEGMRRDCEKVETMLRCAKDTFESCPGSEKQAREAQIFLNTLEETCDENGDTYKVLSRHISCAGPMFNNIDYVCGPYTEGDEIFRPLLIEQNIQLLRCSEHVQKIMCTSIAISKRCGAELKDILDDILRKVILQYDIECSPDILSQLQPYIENYESVLMHRNF